jgi:hypothetical protein
MLINEGSEVDHVTGTFAITAPEASLAVATSLVVVPASSVLAPVIVTVATVGVGAETVTASDPVFPSTLAVIDALPAVLPVTVPSEETDATASFAVDQEKVFPLTTAPAASRATAASVTVFPTSTVDVPLTVTVATVGVAVGPLGPDGESEAPPQAARATATDAVSAK